METTRKKSLLILAAILIAVGLFASACSQRRSAREGGAGDYAPGAERGVGGAESDASVDPEVSKEKYEAALFVTAEWGKGEGEVGLSGSPDAGPNYGPESFDVAEDGRLYLLDSVNERVIVFDAFGKYERSFPIACGGTGDIRVAPDQRRIYVFSWRCGAVYAYDLDGRLSETLKLPKEMLAGTLGVGGLAFDERGNVMLGMEMKAYAEGERFYQVGAKGSEWRENNHEGYLLDDGNYYFSNWVDWNTTKVQIKDRNQRMKYEFLVKSPTDGSRMYTYYSGTDRQNNFYIRTGLESGSGADIDRRYDNLLVKYDHFGRSLTIIDLLAPLLADEKNKYLYSDYFENIRVNVSGDVYFACFFENRGEIIYKYSKVE